MPCLAHLPEEERPRERLLSHGAERLSLTELLAICLGNGRRGVSVLALAQELLSCFGSLDKLMEATIAELCEVKGIGQIKAIQLQAIFALAKRREIVGKAKYPIRHPKDVYALVGPYFWNQKKEIAVAVFRDARGVAFHHEVIAVGTLSEVLVHPRELFYHAISHRAYSVILVHNHPSGDPTPSTQDLELTKLLIYSGRLIGVALDDHIIFGRVQYASLWEQGNFSRTRY